MISLFLTLLLVLLFPWAWRMWRGTCRDIARDELFDLRDAWRTYWVSKELSMDSPEYANVRLMLNDYLRYTNSFRFSGLVFCSRRMSEETRNYIHEECNRVFSSNNPEIKAEIDRIRKCASGAIQKYMLFTTILFVPMVVLALFILMKRRMLDGLISVVRLHVSERCSPIHAETIECAVRMPC